MNTPCSIGRSIRLSAPKALLAAFLLFTGISLGAQPSIGEYRVYFGHLHNHCNISDGKRSPDEAYRFARYEGKLDFFSLADHSTTITPAEWQAVREAADQYDEPGVFTALTGFEWTNYNEGHVTVIGTDDYTSTGKPTSTFRDLCTWLNSRGCVAFFNHPGQVDELGYEFMHFDTKPCLRIVGIELWNKSQRFERYYYREGYYPHDRLSWYDEALTRGWMIGASGSEDNHTGNWGQATDSRLAVLAGQNTRAEIMNALKERRFYSTYDKNLLLSFRMDSHEMGSTIEEGYRQLSIQAADGDGEPFTLIELVRNGYVVESWSPGKANPTIMAPVLCSDREYYYVRVRQADGDQAISSPIHITGASTDLSQASAGSMLPKSGGLTYHFDFTGDTDGWTGDFADYPPMDSEFYGLEFAWRKLPEPLDTSKYALMLSGNNHSDDLFMFLKRRITGLSPNKTYQVQIDIELASEAPTHAMGIGGAPGESVFLKAGASLAEPKKVLEGDFYRLNIDKSNQAGPGADMDTIGHVGVADTTTAFTLIRRSNAGHPFRISTDNTGSVWVCIGSDSGFEGTTTLYYNAIDLKFDNITGTGEQPLPEPVAIFPNPVTDVLTIEGNQPIGRIELLNLSGQRMATVVHSNRLPVADFAAGVYWVRVTLDNGTRVERKVVIQ